MFLPCILIYAPLNLCPRVAWQGHKVGLQLVVVHSCSLYVLNINPLTVEQLVKIFSHSAGCRLILVTFFFFDVQRHFNLIQSLLSILALISWAIRILLRNNYLFEHDTMLYLKDSKDSTKKTPRPVFITFGKEQDIKST
jgi:ABC-type uncharacterized transport system permease subunit